MSESSPVPPQEPEADQENGGSRWQSISLLTVLVVVLTIMTALASFRAAAADMEAGDLELEGLRALSDADLQELRTDQFIQEQARLYDNWLLAESGSLEEEYYFSGLADEVLEGMERNQDDPDFPGYPFDEIFYEEQYAVAGEIFDQAQAYFEEANEADERALSGERVVLTLAVGLAFSAWATLADEKRQRKTRLFFSGLAVFILIIGLLQFLLV